MNLLVFFLSRFGIANGRAVEFCHFQTVSRRTADFGGPRFRLGRVEFDENTGIGVAVSFTVRRQVHVDVF